MNGISQSIPFQMMYLICYLFRIVDPSVVFWDYEIAYEDPDGALIQISDSFSELVDKLYEA